MNPSRIFILRPVATTLLMVAVLLVGAVAYRLLPLSALPDVAYPTIQVQTFYPGASPEVITSAITAPLEKQFGQMAGLEHMSSTSSAGASVITLQFSAVAGARHRRTGGAGGHQRGAEPDPAGSAGAADLRQDQSGRRARAHARHHVERAAADRRRGSRRHARRAEDLAALRRRCREHRRRSTAGRARAREHAGARGVGTQSRRPAHDDQRREPERAEGHVRRSDARVHDQRQRPAEERGRVSQHRRRVQERRAGAARRRRGAHRQRREHAARGVDEQLARAARSTCSASRARTSSKSWTASPQLLPLAARGVAGRCRRRRADRSHDDDPGIGRGRAARDAAGRRARGAGDLPVPA